MNNPEWMPVTFEHCDHVEGSSRTRTRGRLPSDRERSWAVRLSTGLPALVIGFEVLSMLIPAE